MVISENERIKNSWAREKDKSTCPWGGGEDSEMDEHHHISTWSFARKFPRDSVVFLFRVLGLDI